MLLKTIKDFVSKNNYLPLLVILFYLSEACTKVLKKLHFPFYNVSGAIKASFIVLAIIFCLYAFSAYRKSILKFLIILGLIFIVGQLSFNQWNFDASYLFSNSIFFGRYILIFVIAAYIGGIYEINYNHNNYRVFEAVIVVNSLAVFFGFIFQISLFKTYSSARFGYSGLFIVSSIATYFYALSISYYLVKIIREHKGYIAFSLVIIASVLVGTKALLLFIGFSVINLIWHFKLYQKKFFLLILAGGVMIIYLIKDWLVSFLKLNTVLSNVYEEHGLLTMLTSYRDINFISVVNEVILQQWGILNFLIGGTNFTEYRIEFDFLDIVLFFGICGSLIYLYTYFRKIIRFTFFQGFQRNQIIFLLIIGFLSGTFFNSGPLALYLILVLNRLKS
ncbi:hypothetical protein ATE92_1057 [Ulvibacter sp. MAR_2010_11]|uniref:hypothetical protein n=1 Tax=Ulvibacter sp. MAR_2010_11 TaxID=1250229 RepID=UPI000C2C07B3|nr:hypothetical protein [Ulvibacter sp. MAR_2010_11]PKA82916.1 hypothetical protein ATE92_1057 [Ulvibacter sp. MAR_2010_11]